MYSLSFQSVLEEKNFQNQPPLLLLLFCASSRILNLIRIVRLLSFLYSLEQEFSGINNAANFLLSDVQQRYWEDVFRNTSCFCGFMLFFESVCEPLSWHVARLALFLVLPK